MTRQKADAMGEMPRYAQIALHLREQIREGGLSQGSRLPTESTLCEQFSASRHTVREALRHLRQEGFVTSKKGERPVVRSSPVPSSRRATPPSVVGETCFEHAEDTRLRVDFMDMATLSAEVAAQTRLPQDSTWLHVHGYRERFGNGAVVCWNEYYLAPRFATVGRLMGSYLGPVAYLVRDMFDEAITKVTRSMSAVELPEDYARRFGLPIGTPALDALTWCEIGNQGVGLVNRSIFHEGSIRYTVS